MNEISVPEELGSLSDEALNELATQIQGAADGMKDKASTDDAALSLLETLATQFQTVIDEMASREEAAAMRAERAQAALSKIGTGVDTEESVPTEEAIDGGEPAVAATTGETATEALATEEPAELATPKDPAKARVPAEPEAVLAEDDTQEAAVADESNAPEVVADPVAALATARPAQHTPEAGSTTGPRRTLSTFTDAGLVSANTKGNEIDRESLAKLIVAKHNQLSRMSTNVTYEPIILATAKVDFGDERMVGTGHEENFSVIRDAINRGNALVASGGNCAPLTPNYDVFNVAEPMSPVEGALPTVPAPRGGVRYITPPAWNEAAAGVRFTTEAEDAAGYSNQTPTGPTAPKPCVHLECADIVECQVDAVSQCVTFGNLQYRTFTEQVEVFLDHLAVSFAQAKEINYLDAIQAGSTAVDVTPPYGAARGVVFALALAAHAYRKRNHMPVDAVLDLLAPDTMVPVIKTDMVNDHALGMNFLGASAEQVSREIMSALNINATFYFDYSTTYTSTAALQQAQAAGALNPWPSFFRAYLYSPGTWVRLDGGTLDVGIVRDSTLNSQNDLQMFSEEWVQVCKVGIESVRLDIDLCPSGVGPDPVTGLACDS